MQRTFIQEMSLLSKKAPGADPRAGIHAKSSDESFKQ
jgi:hypothetical protein